MNRNTILEDLFLKNTGLVVDGAAVWEEIEQAATECQEDGEQWVVGQDDKSGKWEYYIDLKRSYDEEFDMCNTDIELLEIRVERPDRDTAQFKIPRFS